MPIYNYRSTGSETQALAVEDVIEELGYGAAQIKCLLLAGVVLFSQGCQLCILSVVAAPLSTEFNLNYNQRAFFSTMIFTGIFLGTIVSGQFGDMMGRRLPICVGVLVSSCMSCFMQTLHSFNQLLFALLALGMGLGLGFPSAIVYLSEVTPKDWRIVMQCLALAVYDAGYSYAAFIATMQNPSLEHLTWRKVMMTASVLPAVVGLVTVLFLQESPIYLAAKGRHQEAEKVLDSMRTSNRAQGANIRYHVRVDASLGITEARTGNQFLTVFSAKFRTMMLVLCVISFTLNSFHFGGLYAQPQVMSGPTKGSMPAGVELIIGGPADGLGLLVVPFVSKRIPRLLVMAFAMLMAASVSICFGFAGQFQRRFLMLEYIYQFGVFGFYWVPAIGFVILSQLSVEVFPITASATGCSIVMAVGRLGALSAPLLFENSRHFFGNWNVYFYIMCCCCAGCCLLLMSVDFPGIGKVKRFCKHEGFPIRHILHDDRSSGL